MNYEDYQWRGKEEFCDGDKVVSWAAGRTCRDFGFTGGTLTCNACLLDTRTCKW